MDEIRLPEFIQIPRPVMEDKTLTQLDWAVYGLIYWYSKLKLQKCILSNTAFAELLRVDARSIRRALTRLSEGDFIHIIYEDMDKKVRQEIIPLVSYKKEEKGRTVQSYPPDSSVLPVGLNSPHNNTDLIREVNNTVNGNKNLIQKLPNLPLPKEQKEYIKDEILTVLKDKQSEKFYLLVASKIPEGEIRKALSEIKADGAEDPAKVFTYRMKKFAMLHKSV